MTERHQEILLDGYIVKMKELICSSDPEDAHSKADDLLVAALLTIAPDSKQIDELTDLFYRVRKYYA